MGIFEACVLLFRAMLVPKARLAVENLALRQQVAVFKQPVKRPKSRPRDRVFWVCLSRLWSNWQSAIVIVQPAMVIKWHRQGFKRYWRWKSRKGKPGRPPIEREIRNRISRMSRENPTWGALQRYDKSERRMDGSANRECLSLRRNTSFPPSRSRWCLRSLLPEACQERGHRRSSARTTLTLAECLLRTHHRLHPPRVLESPDCAGRIPSQTHPRQLP
jgi:hypothetical protein